MLFTTVPIPVVNLVIGHVCVCSSIQTHISITAGREFVIWDMMMDYDVELMPIVSTF